MAPKPFSLSAVEYVILPGWRFDQETDTGSSHFSTAILALLCCIQAHTIGCHCRSNRVSTADERIMIRANSHIWLQPLHRSSSNTSTVFPVRHESHFSMYKITPLPARCREQTTGHTHRLGRIGSAVLRQCRAEESWCWTPTKKPGTDLALPICKV